MLPDFAVDPTHELEIVRVGHIRDGNEIADRASCIETFGQLPGVTLSLQLILEKMKMFIQWNAKNPNVRKQESAKI